MALIFKSPFYDINRNLVVVNSMHYSHDELSILCRNLDFAKFIVENADPQIYVLPNNDNISKEKLYNVENLFCKHSVLKLFRRQICFQLNNTVTCKSHIVNSPLGWKTIQI